MKSENISKSLADAFKEASRKAHIRGSWRKKANIQRVVISLSCVSCSNILNHNHRPHHSQRGLYHKQSISTEIHTILSAFKFTDVLKELKGDNKK